MDKPTSVYYYVSHQVSFRQLYPRSDYLVSYLARRLCTRSKPHNSWCMLVFRRPPPRSLFLKQLWPFCSCLSWPKASGATITLWTMVKDRLTRNNSETTQIEISAPTSLVLVPQASLISKVKSQGKSVQYHGQMSSLFWGLGQSHQSHALGRTMQIQVWSLARLVGLVEGSKRSIVIGWHCRHSRSSSFVNSSESNVSRHQ